MRTFASGPARRPDLRPNARPLAYLATRAPRYHPIIMLGTTAKSLFPSFLYSYLPGYGFGPTQSQCHRGAPVACASYRAPTEAETKWHTPRPKQFYLGPEKPDNAWLSDNIAASILVMQNGSTRDAHLHGYAVLDLWPLDGSRPLLRVGAKQHAVDNKPTLPPPSPADAALMVGRALSGALELATRIAVEGPSWALDVLAAIPGVVVFSKAGCLAGVEGACVAWGRRWEVKSFRYSVNPYQVAQRLSGPVAQEFSHEDRALGSLMVGTSRKRVRAVYEGADRWSVMSKDLGPITIQQSGDGQLYGENCVRWPNAEDAWLVTQVGDGEPIEVEPTAVE